MPWICAHPPSRSGRAPRACRRSGSTPAMRAANADRGWLSTVRVGPSSTIRPASSTTTRSASDSASIRSWVTSSAVRPGVPQHLAQQLPQRRCDRDVERGHRLVQQQQRRIGGERAGDRDPLGLPAGQLGRAAIGELGRVDRGQPARGSRPRPTRPAPLAARTERDVRRRGQVREQQGLLREQHDAASVRRHPDPGRGVDQHLVVQRDSAGVRVDRDPRSATAAWICRRRSPRARRPPRRARPAASEVDPAVPTMACSRARPSRPSVPDVCTGDGRSQRALGRLGRGWPARSAPPRRPAPGTARPRRRGRSRAAGRSPAAACGSPPAGCRRRSGWRRTRPARGRTRAPRRRTARAAPAEW